MEILGILAVLQQYVTDHLLSKQQMLQTQQQEQEQLLQPQHTGILTTTTATTAAAPTSTSTTAIQAHNSKAEAKPDHSSLYLITMLHELRFSLLSKLKSYIGDQVAWILAQKSDPKKAGVTVPVAKFPSFVRQVLEMTGGQACHSLFRTIFILAFMFIIVFSLLVNCYLALQIFLHFLLMILTVCSNFFNFLYIALNYFSFALLFKSSILIPLSTPYPSPFLNTHTNTHTHTAYRLCRPAPLPRCKRFICMDKFCGGIKRKILRYRKSSKFRIFRFVNWTAETRIIRKIC